MPVSYKEKWYSCPNQSSRGGSAITQVTFHTTEGATTGESLANWICQAQAQASYHAAVDNTALGEVHRFVDSDMKAWSQAGGNPFCLSVSFCTPSGAASGWSRDTWLNHNAMLENGAAIARTFCDWYNIPIVALNSSQAQSGARGISQHVDGGSGWSGHHDCGPGFPEDVVLQKMSGQVTGSGDEIMALVAVTSWNNKTYRVKLNEDSVLEYAGPDTNDAFRVIDPNGRGKCVSITASDAGTLTVDYVNMNDDVCEYYRPPGGGDFIWRALGPR